MNELVPCLEATCAGDPWEMGWEQGRRLRSKIHRAMSLLTELEAFRLQKPKFMPLPLFRTIAEFRAGRFLERALSAETVEARNRLLGIAAGADVPPRKLFLLNAMEAVLSDISGSSCVPVAAACSALAVTQRASASGNAILAHNFDYLKAIQPLYTVRVSRPAGKLRSLEFTVAPLAGAVDGINEAGLCITYNYAYATDHDKPAPTISMWISEALASCRTVHEAVDLFSKSRRCGGGLLMLGDAEGRIESLELSNNRCSLRPKPGNGDWQFHSNRYKSESMAAVEIDDLATYSRRAPKVLRDQRVHQSSDCRDQRLQERMTAAGPMDATAIANVMADHGPDDDPSADTVCMHSDYWHTTACLQFFPRERTMRVAYGTACQAKFKTFTL